MKIRSITFFLNPCFPLDDHRLTSAGEFLKVAQPALTQMGYEVQSARLATIPFPGLFAGLEIGSVSKLARDLEAVASKMGFGYVSMGPAMPDQPESYKLIPGALAATQNTFFSGLLTSMDSKISLRAIHQCAQVIQSASTISPDGFTNLRFAALANVPPGSPFFPAAYHQGEQPCFALATEAADLAVTAFSQAKSLEEAQQSLVRAIQMHGRKLATIAHEVERQTQVRFGGIDFSLAPFPDEKCSLGVAMERLGVPLLGAHGSLASAAILAEAIDQADFTRAGFSGLLLPVLEDAMLARRVSEGKLGVLDLLLYSAVCGTGLDTIPLPGDTSIEQLSAVLVDLASLSSRLGKPLTARLMPIPGKKAGDPTDFNFAYFANSRIMRLNASPLEGFLAGEETFSLSRRVSS